MGGGGGNYEAQISQLPSNLQGDQQPPGGMDYIGQARGSGIGGMMRGMLQQMGYEQGRGPFSELGNQPGGFFGYGGGGAPQAGYQQAYDRIYNNPAHYLQMGSQYGQLGPYNTLARDMASGNVGNYAFGYGGNPFTYQGGMQPSGRPGPWGRPQSALAQYGYGGMGMAGRGGGGRTTGTWPGTGFGGGAGFPSQGVQTGGVSPWGFSSNQPGMYGMGASGQNYPGGFRPPFEANPAWNPWGRVPGQNPVATPWGGVSNRHPLSSFLRLPGTNNGGTTGPAGDTDAMRASDQAGLLNPQTGKPYFSQGDTEIATTNPVNPMLGGSSWISGGGRPAPQFNPVSMTAPIYASDAWRRQATGVQLPFQLPASAQNMGFARASFMY